MYRLAVFNLLWVYCWSILLCWLRIKIYFFGNALTKSEIFAFWSLTNRPAAFRTSRIPAARSSFFNFAFIPADAILYPSLFKLGAAQWLPVTVYNGVIRFHRRRPGKLHNLFNRPNMPVLVTKVELWVPVSRLVSLEIADCWSSYATGTWQFWFVRTDGQLLA